MNYINILFILITIFSIKFQKVTSVELDNDGGYSIVLAVDSSIQEPIDSAADFLYEIQDSLDSFSEQMFKATDGTFFIKSAHLLLPSHWALSTGESTFQSYESADIRLSSSGPYVDNQNPCGRPGNYIEIPSGFLNTTLPQPFGHPSKALLNLWARYRWGVWEEHGHPGNEQFPYFHKPQVFSDYEVTGCSNTKLEGTFVDIANNPCEIDDGGKPNDNCRFKPSSANIAKTSIMGFHWLPSVTQFCNEDNHNKMAPNKQNLFCGHQSVWSVIQTTQDYLTVTQKIQTPTPPVMEYQFTKKRQQTPSLYILIDEGAMTKNIEGPMIILRALLTLVPFLEQNILRNTAVSVASFKSETPGAKLLHKRVSWLPLEDNLDAIYEAIGDFSSNGKPYGDFSMAIAEVINEIELVNLNPSSPTALFVIKTGNNAEQLLYTIPEEDILVSLKKNNIKVFVAELVNTDDKSTPIHLKKITEDTQGRHVSLETSSTVEETMKNVLDDMTVFLNSSQTPFQIEDVPERILFNGELKNTGTVSTITIPFQVGMEKGLKIHITAQSVGDEPKIDWTQGIGSKTERLEWGTTPTPETLLRRVYSITPELDLTTPITEFTVNYTCLAPTCLDLQEYILITTEDTTSNDILTSVSVSAINNEVDFNEPRLTDLAPFAIHAKVELKNGQPIKNLHVIAEVLDSKNFVHDVILEDDGLGYPDLYLNDGIYSGIFIPNNNDTYRIIVRAQYKKDNAVNTNTKNEGNIRHGGVGRLLPEDQVDIGDDKREAIELSTSYSNAIEYIPRVIFKNVPLELQGKPFKILDLNAKFIDKGANIKFTFTSPKLLGKIGQATKYIVKGSTSVDTLIRGTSDARDAYTHDVVRTPGTLEEIIIPTPKFPNALTYYQIQAINENPTIPINNNAQISNIVQVAAEDIVEDTTTNPPQPTTNPPEPTTNSPQPTTNPPQPTTNPPEPTTNPPEPTTNPPQPTTNPPQPSTNPPEPTTNSPQPTTNPPQPTTNPPQPTTNPPEPTTNPPQPTTNPPQPTTNPPQPTTNPPQPTHQPQTSSPPPESSPPPPPPSSCQENNMSSNLLSYGLMVWVTAAIVSGITFV